MGSFDRRHCASEVLGHALVEPSDDHGCAVAQDGQYQRGRSTHRGAPRGPTLGRESNELTLVIGSKAVTDPLLRELRAEVEFRSVQLRDLRSLRGSTNGPSESDDWSPNSRRTTSTSGLTVSRDNRLRVASRHRFERLDPHRRPVLRAPAASGISREGEVWRGAGRVRDSQRPSRAISRSEGRFGPVNGRGGRI